MRDMAALHALPFGVALCLWVTAGEAKPAWCTTTDEGGYACEFRAIDGDGSFEISAPGKPTYILNIVGPGTAYGFVNFGERNVALPGRYLRSETEPACWDSEATGARICAE